MSLSLHSLFWLSLAWPLLVSAAKTGVSERFNHDKTGFVLQGRHVHAACESCHTRGIFKRTPRTCAGCHGQAGRIVATRRPSTHIRSTGRCGQCHTQVEWKPARVDHFEVRGSCAGCHNGRTAAGKTATHLPTTLECDSCHSTTAWKPARFDHAKVVGGCYSGCHDGSGSGRSKADAGYGHLPSSNACEACHRSPGRSWVSNTIVDHGNVRGSCQSCHAGQSFGSKKGMSKADRPGHVATTAACDSCHVNTQNFTTWAGASGKPGNHDTLTSGCAGCHRKSASHMPSTATCENCHTTAPGGWRKPLAVADHTQVTGSCQSCHMGQFAQTRKGAGHIASTDDCAACHKSTTSWTANVTADHSQFGNATQCNSCHVTGGKARTAMPVPHMTTSLQCSACHHTRDWIPPVSLYQHLADKKSGFELHKPVPPCANCHSRNGTGKTSVIWKDDAAFAGTCAGCHAKRFDRGERRHNPVNGPTPKSVTNNLNCGDAGCHGVSNNNRGF